MIIKYHEIILVSFQLIEQAHVTEADVYVDNVQRRVTRIY